MKQESPSDRAIKPRALSALREALVLTRPGVTVDEKGYVNSFRDALLPLVSAADFETDLRAGDGNELETKFRAAHSSSALAVNCFAPFCRRITDLHTPFAEPFSKLQFERKCPTGLRGGRAPNLDALLSGPNGVVGIESKLTEYLTRHRAQFSPAYPEQIRDGRREQGYFREMLRLMDAPTSYAWLDAAQLIKHAFGLAHTFSSQPVTLLYLYWEPANTACDPIFEAHRREIAQFADRVAGATPRFAAMSYPELWAHWRKAAPGWLSGHLDELAGRYAITV
ncbi:PGN_0703 family putative restriction endonuclease [Maricaulis sp.]|uniref:PGN_0703 family putative restriction endonuclease n=1 Tax=Maricaulis sp. TaxID=1486257 RepID=UPI003A8DD5CA